MNSLSNIVEIDRLPALIGEKPCRILIENYSLCAFIRETPQEEDVLVCCEIRLHMCCRFLLREFPAA